VGIQVGHWQMDDLPFELRELTEGTSIAGWDEWEINLMVGQAAKAALEDAGVDVDLLPAVIPVRYRAHAFVAIHADGDWDSSRRGYKVARSLMSSVPDADDELVRRMDAEYAVATGMQQDSEIRVGGDMTEYYAFNTQRYQHAIDVGTPAAIIEVGYLTNGNDRALLTSRPDLAGRGIAAGVLRFLEATDTHALSAHARELAPP
jgi:N-acetylmuramoyl-L-alanine amidase